MKRPSFIIIFKWIFYKNFILAALALNPTILASQDLIINDDHINHDQDYETCANIISPEVGETVLISGTSKVNYKAGCSIFLNPGFKITSLSGDGKFNASILERPITRRILAPENFDGTVPSHAKFELGIKLPAEINSLVDDYINLTDHPYDPEDYSGLNPFNPDDISVEVTFYPPTGDPKIIYGFFYNDYNYNIDASNWVSKPTDYHWRVRFAPDQEGTWTYDIKVIFSNNPSLDDIENPGCPAFVCVASDNPGYLMQNDSNPGYLRFSKEDKQFFGTGVNIAWANTHYEDQGIIGVYNVIPPSRFIEHRDLFRTLANNGSGGNLARLVFTPFDYDIEWEEVGYYNSLIAQEIVSYDGSESVTFGTIERLALAWEIDSLITLCENDSLYLILCHQLHVNFAYDPDPINPLHYPYLWTTNPYNVIDNVDDVEDFLTNTTAIELYENKLRYMISRWGYSTSILGHELLSETEQVGCEIDRSKIENGDLLGGINNKVWTECDYFDYEENFDDNMIAWLIGMKDYIKSEPTENNDGLNYNNQLVSTSYGGIVYDNYYPPPDHYTDLLYMQVYREMDFASVHYYNNTIKANCMRIAGNGNYEKQFLNYEDPDSPNTYPLRDIPFYFGEIGLIGEYDDENPDTECLTEEAYRCIDLGFHHDLWATSSYKNFSAGLAWWWDKGILENSSLVDNYLHMMDNNQRFFAGIDLFSNSFCKIQTNWPYNENCYSDPPSDGVEYYLTKTSDGDHIYGWINNVYVFWQEYIVDNGDCLENLNLPPLPAWQHEWDHDCIPTNAPPHPPGRDVDIEITDVTNGSYLLHKFYTLADGQFEDPIQIDVETGSLLIDDYLGNDPYSVTTPSNFAFYIEPGSLPTDGELKSIPTGNNNIGNLSIIEDISADDLNIKPNPSINGKFFISLKGFSSTETIVCYINNIYGNNVCVKQLTLPGRLDLSALSKGVYFATFKIDNFRLTKKIIIN